MTPPITDDPQRAADTLGQHGVVAIPTETVYGLAALVHDEVAVGRVFDIKGRPRSHPLIVHLAQSDDPSRWGHMSRAAVELATRYWPGPLTLLVPRTPLVPDWVTGGRDTVALRVPRHPLTLRLLELLDDALVAPSANRFGRVSPTRAQHVVDDLGSDVDLILDGGPCTVGVESTIVECVDDNVSILRPGAISREDITRTIGRAPIAPTGVSRAPGMLSSHYAPRARVIVCDDRQAALSQSAELVSRGHSTAIVWEPDVAVYAARLYDLMREADSSGVQFILAVLPSEEGLGTAVRDRLFKAAAE